MLDNYCALCQRLIPLSDLIQWHGTDSLIYSNPSFTFEPFRTPTLFGRLLFQEDEKEILHLRADLKELGSLFPSIPSITKIRALFEFELPFVRKCETEVLGKDSDVLFGVFALFVYLVEITKVNGQMDDLKRMLSKEAFPFWKFLRSILSAHLKEIQIDIARWEIMQQKFSKMQEDLISNWIKGNLSPLTGSETQTVAETEDLFDDNDLSCS